MSHSGAHFGKATQLGSSYWQPIHNKHESKMVGLNIGSRFDRNNAGMNRAYVGDSLTRNQPVTSTHTMMDCDKTYNKAYNLSNIRHLRRTADHHFRKFLKCTGVRVDSSGRKAAKHRDTMHRKVVAERIIDESLNGIEGAVLDSDKPQSFNNSLQNFKTLPNLCADKIEDSNILHRRNQRTFSELPSFGLENNNFGGVLQSYRSPASLESKCRKNRNDEIDLSTSRDSLSHTHIVSNDIAKNCPTVGKAGGMSVEISLPSSNGVHLVSQMLSRRIEELYKKTLHGASTPRNHAVITGPSQKIFVSESLTGNLKSRDVSINDREKRNLYRANDHPPSIHERSVVRTRNESCNNSNSSYSDNSINNNLWTILTKQLQGTPTDYRLLYNPNTKAFEGILSADALQKLLAEKSNYHRQSSSEKLIMNGGKSEGDVDTAASCSKTVFNTEAQQAESSVYSPYLNPSFPQVETLTPVQSYSSGEETIAIGGIRGIAVHRGIENPYDNTIHASWRCAVNQGQDDDDIQPPHPQKQLSSRSTLQPSTTCQSGLINATSSAFTIDRKPNEKQDNEAPKLATINSRTQQNGSSFRQEKIQVEDSDPPFPHPRGMESQGSINALHAHYRLQSQKLPYFPVSQSNELTKDNAHSSKKKSNKYRRSHHIKGLKPSVLIEGFPDSQAAADILWHASDLPANQLGMGTSSDVCSPLWGNPSPSHFQNSMDPVMQLKIPSPCDGPSGSYMHTPYSYPHYYDYNYSNGNNMLYKYNYTSPSYMRLQLPNKYEEQYEVFNHRKPTYSRGRGQRVDRLCLCVD